MAIKNFFNNLKYGMVDINDVNNIGSAHDFIYSRALKYASIADMVTLATKMSSYDSPNADFEKLFNSKNGDDLVSNLLQTDIEPFPSHIYSNISRIASNHKIVIAAQDKLIDANVVDYGFTENKHLSENIYNYCLHAVHAIDPDYTDAVDAADAAAYLEMSDWERQLNSNVDLDLSDLEDNDRMKLL